jgi:hypothetical protein
MTDRHSSFVCIQLAYSKLLGVFLIPFPYPGLQFLGLCVSFCRIINLERIAELKRRLMLFFVTCQHLVIYSKQ